MRPSKLPAVKQLKKNYTFGDDYEKHGITYRRFSGDTALTAEWPESYSSPGHFSTVFLIRRSEFTPKVRFFVKYDEEMEPKP
jgi:hypothetical protein